MSGQGSADSSWTSDSGTTADAPAGGNVIFPFPVQPVSAREQLRDAIVAALKAANLTVGAAPVSVDSPGDWPYPQAKLPAVCVRCATENSASLTKGNTDFTTTVEVDVRAAAYATTGEAAQSTIDSLWYQIKRAILFDFYVLQLVQNVTTVESTFEIKADGNVHLAGVVSRFRLETFETFDMGQPLQPLAARSVAPPVADLVEVTLDITRPGANPPNTPQPGDVGLTINLE